MKKTKKERQRWWESLTPDEQFDYVEWLVTEKAIRRREEALCTMKKHGDRFSCTTCFHRKTKSCTDDLPNGCGYWFNHDAKEQGPLLEKQRTKNLVTKYTGQV